MVRYSIEELQQLAESKLVKAPPLLYEELQSKEFLEELANQGQRDDQQRHEVRPNAPTPVVADFQQLQEPQEPVKNKNRNDDDSDSSDSHLDELTSRYFLQRKSAGKKPDTNGASLKYAQAVNASMAQVSSNNTKEFSSSKAVAAPAAVETAAEEDDNGWISVGPKHHGNHNSRGGSRKNFQQSYGNRRFQQGGSSQKTDNPWRTDTQRQRVHKKLDDEDDEENDDAFNAAAQKIKDDFESWKKSNMNAPSAE